MNTAIVLYLNENVAVRVASLFTDHGIRTVHTLHVGNQGVDDECQLRYAANNEYILVTHNRKDFRILHNRWLRAGRSHSGIIVLGFSYPERIVARICLFLEKEYPSIAKPFCISPPQMD